MWNFRQKINFGWLSLLGVSCGLFFSGCSVTTQPVPAKVSQEAGISAGTPQSFEELRRKVEELEQLKKNQNLLLLEMRKQLELRIAQLSEQLDQYDLKLRKQTTEFERLQKNVGDLRLATDQLLHAQGLPGSPPSVPGVAPEAQPASLTPVFPAPGTVASTPNTLATSADAVTFPPPSSGEAVPVPILAATPTPSVAPIIPAGPTLDPASAAAADQLFEAGMAHYQAGKVQEAIQVLAELKNKYPQHPSALESHFWLGQAFFSQNDFASAASEFQDFLRRNPQHPSAPEAQWKLAQSLERLGEPGLANDVYQDLAQKPSPFQEQAKQKLKTKR